MCLLFHLCAQLQLIVGVHVLHALFFALRFSFSDLLGIYLRTTNTGYTNYCTSQCIAMTWLGKRMLLPAVNCWDSTIVVMKSPMPLHMHSCQPELVNFEICF